MTDVWVPLTSPERTLLREALSAFAAARGNPDAASALSKKLVTTPPYPDITIGVYGGVVQWITGNPFPIRVCDYDGEEKDLPDLDERGQRCTMGFETADAERESSLRRNAHQN